MAHPNACHARVTIRIDEVNIASNENVLIICAARCQDQCAEKRDLNDNQTDPRESWHKSYNRKSKIKNRK
jgi:hypothetical protein